MSTRAIRRGLLCFGLALAVAGAVVPSASASLGVYSYFPGAGGAGSEGGRFASAPAGVAVNDSTGDVYVVDPGNNRIQEFTEQGAFVRAWGADVIAPGAPNDGNEMQAVMVNATAGQFTLSFEGATTPDLAFDATPAEVETALNALSTVDAGGGSVSVSGGPGNSGGTAPYVVNFDGGPLAGADVAQLVAAAGTTPLSGGTGVGAGQATVSTFSPGGSGGTGFEICDTQAPTPDSPADCKAGVADGRGGGMSSPRGIAINQVTGDLYVTDRSFLRVDEFDSEGHFLRSWGRDTIESGPHADGGNFEICTAADVCKSGVGSGEVAGAYAGAFSGALGGFESFPAVAPEGAPDAGNVLVPDPADSWVQEFTGSGEFVRAFGWDVDPGGGAAFEICTVAASCRRGTAGTAVGQFNARGPQRIAVDSSGIIYTVEPPNNIGSANMRVQRFTPGPLSTLVPGVFSPGVLSGELFLEAQETSSPTAIAVDPTDDHVFVAKYFRQGEGEPPAAGKETRILELDPAGELLDTHMDGAGLSPSMSGGFPLLGLAVRAGGRPAYFTSATIAPRVYQLENVPPPQATVEGVEDVTSEAATLVATVRPAVTPVGIDTFYQFEYSKNGFEWTRAPVAPVDVGNGSGGTQDPTTCPTGNPEVCKVSERIEGLDSNREYQVRLVAKTEFNGARTVVEGAPFTTSAGVAAVTTGAPLWSSPAPTHPSLLLAGELDPRGSETSYRFEYVDNQRYAEDKLSGDGFQRAVSTPVRPAGHGRKAIDLTESVDGLDPSQGYWVRLVATNEAGTSVGAPKLVSPPSATQRFYEWVSDGDSWGAGIERGVGPAAADGERVGFYGQAFGLPPVVPGPKTPYMAQRTATGWAVNAMLPRPGQASGFGYGVGYLFSADLARTLWVEASLGQRKRAESQWSLVGLDGTTSPVLPLLAPLEHAGDQGIRNEYFPLGGSADLSTFVFKYLRTSLSSGIKLVPDEPLLTREKGNLYVVAGAGGAAPTLDLVNRATDPSPGTPGAIIGGSCGAGPGGRVGEQPAVVNGAVSRDGRVIYFSAVPGAPATGTCSESSGRRLYKRVDGTTTVEVSAPECDTPCGGPGGDDSFYGASSDGNIAFFVTPRRLKSTDTDNTADLYAYDATLPAGQRLIQASAGETVSGHTSGSGARVLGVLDNAADGSRVYFVAEGILTGANAAGAAPRANVPNLYVFERDAGHPSGRVAFIGTLASGSTAGDERQWTTGENGYKEAYALPRQDGVGNGHILLFVSAAPLVTGDEDNAKDLYRYNDVSEELRCLSCVGDDELDVDIDGRSATFTGPEDEDRGRPADADVSEVVFNTAEPLVASDTNTGSDPGCIALDETGCDIYLWNEGQLELISTGTGRYGSMPHAEREPAQISTDGRDVFFTTNQALVAGDVNNTTDLYDARVGGGFPAQAAPPEPCGSEASCHGSVVPAPAPPTPLSGAVTVPGNVSAPSSCGKGRVRRGGKCVRRAVKCHAKKRKVKQKGKVRCVRRHVKRVRRHHTRRLAHDQGGRR